MKIFSPQSSKAVPSHGRVWAIANSHCPSCVPARQGDSRREKACMEPKLYHVLVALTNRITLCKWTLSSQIQFPTGSSTSPKVSGERRGPKGYLVCEKCLSASTRPCCDSPAVESSFPSGISFMASLSSLYGPL